MIKKLAFALAALSISATASAQAYGNLSLGMASWRGGDWCSTGAFCDREDSSYRAVLGYRFNSVVSIEGGFIGFGKIRARDAIEVTVGATTETVGRWVSFDAAGPALGVAATFPLGGGKWYGRGRAGLAMMSVKGIQTIDAVLDDDGEVVRAAEKTTLTSTKVQPYLGLGLGYRFTPSVALEGSIDASRAKFEDGGTSTRSNLIAVNIGLTFEF